MYPLLVVTAQGGLDAFKASNWFNIPSSLFGAVAGGVAAPLLNQSELELAGVKNAELDARVDLYRAVGGGWR